MLKKSRRQFFQSSAGAATLLLGPSPVGWGQGANSQTEAPHFFLHLCYVGGLDATNLFDARPLLMTDKGLVQNYHYLQQGAQAAQPRLYEGRNGGRSLRTPLTDPLMRFKDYFSVVNGVRMSTSFDGHEQNLYHLFTGSVSSGGASFYPAIGAIHGNSPLESVNLVQGFSAIEDPSNFELSASLSPETLSGLKAYLEEKTFDPANNPLDAMLLRRSKSLGASGEGMFSQGSRRLAQALAVVPELSQRVKQLPSEPGAAQNGTGAPPEPEEPGAPDSQPFSLTVKTALNFLKAGITSSVCLSIDRFALLDTHDAGTAAQQPQSYQTIVQEMVELFQALHDTPWDEKAGVSMADVTTVMVNAEFSRTMRQQEVQISQTGTDHNSLSSTFLLAGKGIRGGQVVGASDHNDCSEDGKLFTSDLRGKRLDVSAEHNQFDPDHLKVMGLRYDFAAGKLSARDGKPLSSANLVNTVLSCFSAPDEIKQPERADGDTVAPAVKEILV